MNIFVSLIALTLFVLLFLFTLNKISEPKSNNDILTAKVLKIYSTASSLTKEEQQKLKNGEFEAHRNAAIETCLNKGYGFDCSGYSCSCTIDTEYACNNYISNLNSKLNNPNISEEEKEEITSKIRYWDSNVNRCIETIKTINSGVCETIQSLDKNRNPNHIFTWNKPKLANCSDTRCDTVEIMPTCVIPDGYCNSRGMDQDYPDNAYDSGDCYVSSTQYWIEQFVGEEVVRCARTGDLDCIFKSLNISMALADAYCAKVLGMKGGCGFPKMLPSLDEAWRMIQNPWEIPKFFVNAFVGTLEVGIKILEATLDKLGFPVGTILSDTFSTIRDFFSDGFISSFDIFEVAWDYVEDIPDIVGGGFETAGTWTYDNILSPAYNFLF